MKMMSRSRVGVAAIMTLALCSFAFGQAKSAKAALTGHYEGTAKNRADEVISVNFELAEKDGAVTGMIRSSHGDFTITGGSHKGDDVTLQFDAGGPVGTIALKMEEDKLSGNWSVGDDGGPVEVKRAAAQEAPKTKS